MTKRQIERVQSEMNRIVESNLFESEKRAKAAIAIALLEIAINTKKEEV